MRIMKMVVGKALVIVVLGLAVCALMQTTVLCAKDKDPVTRPFKVLGQFTILDLFGGNPLTAIDQGVCSEIGRYVGVGKYPEGAPGFGISYAASGDQIFWRDLGGGKVEWTGGTGRFQGATGGFTFSISSEDWVPGPEGTWTYVITYEGEGTIIY